MSKTPRKHAKPARTRKSTPKTIATIAPPTYPPPLYTAARTSAQNDQELAQQRMAQYLADEISYGVKSNEVVVMWPADWVNALKERFAPKWLLARSQVKYKSVSYLEMSWKTAGQITTCNAKPLSVPLKLASSSEDASIFK